MLKDKIKISIILWDIRQIDNRTEKAQHHRPGSLSCDIQRGDFFNSQFLA